MDRRLINLKNEPQELTGLKMCVQKKRLSFVDKVQHDSKGLKGPKLVLKMANQ